MQKGFNKVIGMLDEMVKNLKKEKKMRTPKRHTAKNLCETHVCLRAREGMGGEGSEDMQKKCILTGDVLGTRAETAGLKEVLTILEGLVALLAEVSAVCTCTDSAHKGKSHNYVLVSVCLCVFTCV